MNNLEPILCMKRDMEAVGRALESLNISEPLTIVTVNGNGKDIVYESILENLDKDKACIAFHVTSESDLIVLSEKIKSQLLPFSLILNLSVDSDASWFIRNIGDLRRKNGHKFNYVILSYFKSIETSLIEKDKEIMRSLKVLPAVDFTDTNIFIDDLIRRFLYKPTEVQTREIYKFSGGHVGLIKTLYMLLKEDPNIELTSGKLLNELSVVSRVELIKKDLGGIHNKFFQISTPLLQNKNISSTNFKAKLSLRESAIWELMITKTGELIGREHTAKAIWESEWEEQYSDWAIDQTIHRLRVKIKKAKLPYKIITKKGQGFILQEK